MAELHSTPDGRRFQLGIYGRRNVGKSTTFNALIRHELAIVSEIPGSTTDPVAKAVELPVLGPTLLLDAPGIDDASALGAARVAKTRETFERVDAGLLVLDGSRGSEAYGGYEEEIASSLHERGAAVLACVNKADLADSAELSALTRRLTDVGLPPVLFSAKDAFTAQTGVPSILAALAGLVPESAFVPPPLVADLLSPGEIAVLVVPVDIAAPKGRLILPQVQTLREILDIGVVGLVAQPPTLSSTLARLTERPALVVTDSQAFAEVARIVPPEVPLTSFSILLARQKWELRTLAAGARAMSGLTERSRVLIAEACTHHPTTEDIGTVKLPRALRARFGAGLQIEHIHGSDFPDAASLGGYDLIIHCGGCVLNRRQTRSRLARAASAGTPITNYGLALANLTGILDRALAPLGDC